MSYFAFEVGKCKRHRMINEMKAQDIPCHKAFFIDGIIPEKLVSVRMNG